MTLQDKAAKWQLALKDGSTGPLVIARQVVSLSEKWDTFKSEAGDLSCTSWLMSTLGQNLAWFKRRANAVEVLGEDVPRWMDHAAAVWLAQTVEGSQKKEVKYALHKAFEANGKNPLSQRQTEIRVRELLDWQSKPKTHGCARCKELEAELARLRAGLVIAAE